MSSKVAPEWQLKRLPKFTGRPGPLLIVIMDGVGIGRGDESDAVSLARTPTLHYLKTNFLNTQLKAHGTAVGLPSDADMGNSEVGHNAIGAGRIFQQGASLVTDALKSGAPFKSQTWRNMLDRCQAGGTLHLIGLLSDGNVHSHMDHLFALIDQAAADGIQRLRVHPLLDGRDVPPTSALEYVRPLEAKLQQTSAASRDFKIGSGGGRMLVTMDRYEANWGVVERGWRAHVLGQGRAFQSAEEAIATYRREVPELQDQNMPEFVITDQTGQPLGQIQDGDAVIFFNFRGDRAIEISRAFEEQTFTCFNRQRHPQVLFAGMMQYDGDRMIPKTYLVSPPALSRTMGEYLARNGQPQFACSETQKYGHVTYFWNGNRSGKFSEQAEVYQEITSDLVPFNERPWMKAADIADAVIAAIHSGKYRQIRCNFANGDMVGHTGHREAAITAVQAVDLCLSRILPELKAAQGLALITADHGNADEMYEWDEKKQRLKIDLDGKPVTKVSHTLNPVPLYIYDPLYQGEYELSRCAETPGLANIAATALNLMGFEAPNDYNPALIKFK